jgi:alpha-beta hydrolase superfamily lysophospholipase
VGARDSEGKHLLAERAKIWRIARRVFLVLAVLVAAFFFIVVPWFFTHILTRGRFTFPDPNNGKTPKSHGLDFRWVEFRSVDGILLKGWYVPATGEPRGTIVYSHGLNRSRVEMLPKAKFGHGLGYNGLLFDLRHSGQSDGDITTLGYQERLDVLGAVRYALDEENVAHPIFLWGISMGAAAALMAAADSREVGAVISDSSFLSFRETIEHHTRLLLRLPSFPIADEVIYLSAWRGNFRAADFDLEKAVERFGSRPVLFVAVESDRRIPADIARRLFARSASPGKQLLILPGTRHGEAFNQNSERYKTAVAAFLEKVRSDEGQEEVGANAAFSSERKKPGAVAR